ncbi:hypothetical protein PVAP13_9NG034300 [Panicum virgatum]|uniref:Rx N-terminal domain-containing protein n=1 Tax=Panicum virgatum TaxID=38727 RepID=A0A8T0MGV0_PANVG|nr:hypothetical protein PVAP13_9NG034300 [Panicum virgatum]
MAKEVVGSIAGAVADKAVSKIVDSLGRQTPVGDKLQRLERLCMRVRSTVEVSEKHDIESASLLEWREKLKKAVAPRRRGAPQLPAAAAAAGAAPADDAQGPSTGGTATAYFSSDEDAKKLESAVEALEKESENLEEFIGLLRLEVSPRLKRRRGHVTWYGGVLELHDTRGEWGLQEVTVLVGRLEEALAKISTAVHTAEIRDVEGMELEWLAQWVIFLREARQQGRTVLHALRAELSKENPEHDREEHQLRSFVLTIESIAGDLKFFNRLITTFCDFPAFSSYGRGGRGGRWHHQ